MTTSNLEYLMKAAIERFNRLPSEEQRRHREGQRRSWVVGEMLLSNPGMTRENAEKIYDKVRDK